MSLFLLFIERPNDGLVQLLQRNLCFLWNVNQDRVHHCRVGILFFPDFFVLGEDRFFGQVNVSFVLVDSKDSQDLFFADLHYSMNGFGHYFRVLVEWNHAFFHVVFEEINVTSIFFWVFYFSLRLWIIDTITSSLGSGNSFS